MIDKKTIKKRKKRQDLYNEIKNFIEDQENYYDSSGSDMYDMYDDSTNEGYMMSLLAKTLKVLK